MKGRVEGEGLREEGLREKGLRGVKRVEMRELGRSLLGYVPHAIKTTHF